LTALAPPLAFVIVEVAFKTQTWTPALEAGHLNVTRDPVTHPVPGGHV